MHFMFKNLYIYLVHYYFKKCNVFFIFSTISLFYCNYSYKQINGNELKTIEMQI